MAIVNAGYMGYAHVGNAKVRCTDFNVKLTQNVLFYDHTIGLRDSIPQTILGSKGDGGEWNEQKIFYRPGTKIVEGSISFPFANAAFFKEAYTGDNFDLDLYYSCYTGKTFTDCKVNSYSLTATAGEGGSVSITVMGVNVKDLGAPDIYSDPEKIISWDEIKIVGAGVTEGIVAFDFTVNNNCIPIYTAGANVGTGADSALLVKEIRVGMQEVNGSVSFYNDLGPEDEFVEDTEPRDITIHAGTFAARLKVLYQYPERAGSVSPYIRTIPFVGVGHAVQS